MQDLYGRFLDSGFDRIIVRYFSVWDFEDYEVFVDGDFLFFTMSVRVDRLFDDQFDNVVGFS